MKTMGQQATATAVDEHTETSTEQTSSITESLPLNTRESLETQLRQPLTGVISNATIGDERSISNVTRATDTDHLTTPDRSHATALDTNQYRDVLAPSNDAITNNSDVNKNESSPQKKIISTSSSANESTPKKIPTSPRPPLSTPKSKGIVANGTSAVAATPTASDNAYRAILPKNSVGAAVGSGNTSSPASTQGPPHPPSHPSYGWIPNGSPQHPYHPHPYPIHHYHHPPMYGSPDSSWNKRSESNGSKNGGTANNNNKNNTSSGDGSSGNQQLSPMPPPYGWTSHHLGSYPYPPPPPPHPYPTGANPRYPPMQPPPPHHYSWPPPMAMQPPLLHPQQRHPMNTNRNTTTKGNSSGTASSRSGSVRSTTSTAPSQSNKTATETAITSKLGLASASNSTSSMLSKSPNKFESESVGYAYNHLTNTGVHTIQNTRNDSRSLSPTQIESHHRDEIENMGCTCKKTRCLKLYCQCFGAKLYCGVNCRCVTCFNNRKHEKQRKEAMRNILSRNLSAFDTKFKKDATIVVVDNVTPTNETSQSIVSATAVGTVSNATATITAPPSLLSIIVEPATVETKHLDTAATTTQPEATMSMSSATEIARVLAHRLGCKCRKSACMKKYCECYAANVKCSASCRCMGCKNLGGSSDYRDNNLHGMGMISAAAAQAAHQAAIQYHRLPPHPRAMSNQVPHNVPSMRQYGMVDSNRNTTCLPPRQPHQQQQPLSAQNIWNDPLSAAESLTFLRRSSPNKINGGSAATHQPNRPYAMGISPITKSPGTNGASENVSIPSLASSSESDSPRDSGLNNHLRVMSTPESFRGENSALLLAAVAMTEFGQSPPPTSSMLSPDTIRTYNSDIVEDDCDDERLSVTPRDMDDVTSTPLQSMSSKRTINFDDLNDIDTKDSQKKCKTMRWMS